MPSAAAFLAAAPLSPSPLSLPRPQRHRHSRPVFRRAPTACALPQTSAPHLLHTRDQQLHFLRTVWGKRPMLIRNFLPVCESLLARDDVLALAENPAFPSRLIETHAAPAAPPFSLSLGPFDRADFADLPPRDWTVLVQGVDRALPAVSDLLDAVSFLPNWRLDDVQLSYATRGGGVGPHVDNYDVFLVQGPGRRRWAVGAAPIAAADERIVDDCDVRVLSAAFEPAAAWTLEPGDALYVPPRFAHHGVCASDDCMTFSIGFRAPTAAHLLAGWLERLVADDALGSRFFEDDPADLARHAGDRGRISPAAADRAYDLLRGALRDDEQTRRQFVDWFAEEVSQPKTVIEADDDDEEAEPMSEEEVDHVLASLTGSPGAANQQGELPGLRHREGTVFTYFEHDVYDVALYVDGCKWEVEHVDIAKVICNTRTIAPMDCAQVLERFPSAAEVLRMLMLEGFLYIKR